MKWLLPFFGFLPFITAFHPMDDAQATISNMCKFDVYLTADSARQPEDVHARIIPANGGVYTEGLTGPGHSGWGRALKLYTRATGSHALTVIGYDVDGQFLWISLNNVGTEGGAPFEGCPIGVVAGGCSSESSIGIQWPNGVPGSTVPIRCNAASGMNIVLCE